MKYEEMGQMLHAIKSDDVDFLTRRGITAVTGIEGDRMISVSTTDPNQDEIRYTVCPGQTVNANGIMVTRYNKDYFVVSRRLYISRKDYFVIE